MSDPGAEAHSEKPVYVQKIEVVTSQDPRRLELVAPKGIPPEMDALWQEINRVQRVINNLFRYRLESRVRLFEELHITADYGLRGGDYNLQVGWSNLSQVKASIEDAFTEIRDGIWSRHLYCHTSRTSADGDGYADIPCNAQRVVKPTET
jgi:hypothetical protein